MVTLHTVTWTIQLDAADPVDAARQCRAMLADGEGPGWMWEVDVDGVHTEVDLDEYGECDTCNAAYRIDDDDAHCGQCGTCPAHCSPETHWR